MRIFILIILMAIPFASHSRDPAQVRAFRAAHPCPNNGKTTGACPVWVVDHLIPLCAGGLDNPINMAWQQLIESRKKDREERALCRMLKKLTAQDSEVKPGLCTVSVDAQLSRLTKIVCGDKHP